MTTNETVFKAVLMKALAQDMNEYLDFDTIENLESMIYTIDMAMPDENYFED